MQSSGLTMSGKRRFSVTIAVVGHNESKTLSHALHLASEASGFDRLLYVDSASTDDSVVIADRMGIDRILAPIGKGRAVSAAITACTTTHLCLLDADITESSENIASALISAGEETHASLCVGDFSDGKPGVLSNTVGVYEPLVRELFPEAAGKFGSRPLSGFRLLDTQMSWGRIPPDFGVESHMNLVAAQAVPGMIRVVPIGMYVGRFLYKPKMGLEIADAILSLAIEQNRLSTEARPAWDRWVDVVVEHVASYHGDIEGREMFVKELLALAARPLPSER